jgi:hypothetical protein
VMPLDPTLRTPRLTLLATGLGLPAVPVLDVAHAGGLVDVLAVVDAAEHERRRAFGLTAVTDRLLLEALALLPAGVPFPADVVDPLQRVVLDGAARGVVEVVDDCYVRGWRPPCELAAAIVFAPTALWLGALELISTTVGLADRYIVVRARPSPALLERATKVGVGVVWDEGSDQSRIVTRPRRRPRRLGVRRWTLQERVYERWLAVRATAPTSEWQSADRTPLPSGPQAPLHR